MNEPMLAIEVQIQVYPPRELLRNTVAVSLLSNSVLLCYFIKGTNAHGACMNYSLYNCKNSRCFGPESDTRGLLTSTVQQVKTK